MADLGRDEWILPFDEFGPCTRPVELGMLFN